jgi:hypothetical protein
MNPKARTRWAAQIRIRCHPSGRWADLGDFAGFEGALTFCTSFFYVNLLEFEGAKKS